MLVVRTKLHRPPRARDHVRRTRLLEALERGAERPLILVSAPAGYGKSTLLSSWLEESQRPSAWLSLDAEDGDRVVFLAHFLAAVETIFPGVFPATAALLGAPQLPPDRVLTSTLLNELDAIERDFVLVLDDYQAVHGAAVHELLTALLRHPPAPLHLVISTRSDPPLPLASLRAQGILTELRARDLRFTEAETLEFLQRALGERIEGAAPAMLARETEGWAVGLRLAVLSLEDPGDLERLVQGLLRSSGYARDYLLAEVLSHQPAEVASTLLASSLVERFCAPLIDALRLDGASLAGAEFVDWIERNNLFAIPLDAERRWYRYHHVFRQFLLAQLRHRRDASGLAALHTRASEWLERDGQGEEALQHALAAGDLERAAGLVERSRHALLDREQGRTLGRWIERLPPDLVQRRPALLTAQIFLAAVRWRFDLIPALIERTEELMAQPDRTLSERERSVIEGEIDLAKSWLALPADQGEVLTACARRAEPNVPADHAFLRGTLEIFLAVGQQMAGDGTEAARLLEARLLGSGRPLPGAASRLWTGLFAVYLLEGELPRLEQTGSRMLDAIGDHESPLTYAWAHWAIGLAHYEWNRLESASRQFATVVEARYTAPGRCGHEAMLGLARVRLASGEAEAAREMAERCLQFATELGITTHLSEARSLAARLALARGDLAEAVHWQRSVDLADLMFGLAQLEMPALSWCHVLLAEGSTASRSQARAALTDILAFAERLHRRPLTIGALALQALLEDAEGNEAAALQALARALALGERGRPLRVFADLGADMARLLRRLEGRVARYYVANILAAFPKDDRAERYARPAAGGHTMVDPLSNRELDVLELLARRFRNKEIAARLFISPETVKTHTAAIYQKLRVTGRREAVIEAEALGILRDL